MNESEFVSLCMNLKLVVALCGLMFLLEACTNIKQMSCLNGVWDVSVDEGKMQEYWMTNGDELVGTCVLTSEKDTLFFEQMLIHQIGNKWFYSTSFVSNGQFYKTDFSLKKANHKRMVFENRKHDFPQLISYYFYSSDSMVAKIGGVEKDTVRFELFPMKKQAKLPIE